jgi:pimeloyl-ACP methyl ester carboxylesterase
MAPAGRAVVVGLSLGGYVAIAAAERRPDRVAGLVLAGCSAEPTGPVAATFRTLARVQERAPRSVLRAVNVVFFRVRYPRPVADPIIAGGFWWEGGAQALRQLLARRFLERLGRL